MTDTPDTIVLCTERLALRELKAGDVDFLVELLNDADFLEHIGDRGVRTRADAARYLAEGPLASYAQHGFGLWHVARAAEQQAVAVAQRGVAQGGDEAGSGRHHLADPFASGCLDPARVP